MVLVDWTLKVCEFAEAQDILHSSAVLTFSHHLEMEKLQLGAAFAHNQTSNCMLTYCTMVQWRFEK